MSKSRYKASQFNFAFRSLSCVSCPFSTPVGIPLRFAHTRSDAQSLGVTRNGCEPGPAQPFWASLHVVLSRFTGVRTFASGAHFHRNSLPASLRLGSQHLCMPVV